MTERRIKDDLTQCRRELAYLYELWESGHPDRRGIELAIRDWLHNEVLILMEERDMRVPIIEEAIDQLEELEAVAKAGSGSVLASGIVNGTPRQSLGLAHRRLCEEARELMRAKNADYASDADPFRNFRTFGRLGILVRLSDKIARLQSILENGTIAVKDETITDTVLDIINYAVLFHEYKE